MYLYILFHYAHNIHGFRLLYKGTFFAFTCDASIIVLGNYYEILCKWDIISVYVKFIRKKESCTTSCYSFL